MYITLNNRNLIRMHLNTRLFYTIVVALLDIITNLHRIVMK